MSRFHHLVNSIKHLIECLCKYYTDNNSHPTYGLRIDEYSKFEALYIWRLWNWLCVNCPSVCSICSSHIFIHWSIVFTLPMIWSKASWWSSLRNLSSVPKCTLFFTRRENIPIALLLSSGIQSITIMLLTLIRHNALSVNSLWQSGSDRIMGRVDMISLR